MNSNNKAFVDGEGNIIIQDVANSTINIGRGSDPEALARLEALQAQGLQFEEGITDIQGLVEQSIELLLTRLPKRITSREIPALLRRGSRNFHQRVTGEAGRFRDLEISQHILAEVEVEYKDIDAEEENTTEVAGLTPPFLAHLWAREKVHAFLLGNEGMGKTVSMLWLWGQYLNMPDSDSIPIYVSLNEYNRSTRDEQEKFLTHYIGRYYLGERSLENEQETALWDWLENAHPKEAGPKLLLLLDGLNEVTSDITPLLIDLKEDWGKQVKGAQMLVSSRYPSSHNFATGFHTLQLQPLTDYCIQYFLEEAGKAGLAFPTGNPRLDQLLRNPMMLSLFVEVQKGRAAAPFGEPAAEITRPGELLRSFVDYKMAKFEESNQARPDFRARFHFLLQYLVPYIAYEMECKGLLEINEKLLEEVISNAFVRFCQPDFLKEFKTHRQHIKAYRRYLQALQLGKLSLTEEIERFEKITDDFNQELFPLAWENGTLRFLHQSFQEFFVARHLLNEINLSMEKNEPPHILKGRILPAPIRKMLGEVIGEHDNTPRQVPAGKTWAAHHKKTVLEEALHQCRGNFDPGDIGWIVWNILSVWKDVRGTLAGANLSNLLLEGFDFNGIECIGNTRDGEAVHSEWAHCRFSPKQWFPQGHGADITRVRISPDGQFLATASQDNTVKLWLLATNQYLRTFHNVHGHTRRVNDIAFSPDSRRIISASADGKLIEWSVETGQCLQVFRGHEGPVTSVAYHPDGKRVLSTSEDESTREWSVESGKMIRSYHSSGRITGMEKVDAKEAENKKANQEPFQVVAYFKGGRSVLASSANGNLKEWSTENGTLLGEFKERGVTTLAFSPCGKKILTGSQNGNLKEWSIDTRELLHDFRPAKEKDKPILEVAYSPTGKDILAAGFDDDVHEWSVKGQEEDLECFETQVFRGHARQVTTVVFHPNGKEFFSGSRDATVKRWATTGGQPVHTFKPEASPVNDVAVLPDGSGFILGSEDNSLQRWVEDNGQPRLEKIFKGEAPVYTLASYQGPDGLLLVSGGEWGVIQVWNMDGICIRSFTGHPVTVSSLDIKQETGQVVSADVKGNLLLWPLLDEEQEPIRYPKLGEAITHVAFSPIPGDHRFAVSHRQGMINLWQAGDTPPDAPLRTFNHDDRVYTIAFDGRYILSGGTKGGNLKEWDTEREEDTPLWTHTLAGQPMVLFVGYSPDKQRALCCTRKSKEIRQWQIREAPARALDAAGSEQVFKGHRKSIIAARYRMGRQVLYSASQDSTTRQWNLDTGDCNWTLENIPGLWVRGLDFTQARWTEPLTDREWELLKLYGARL
ncbi:MAG: hypothetical protein KDD19_11485 [Phaeodactylibacter sp.]|nr:hypothetical protein [Phaeodactylibacter sp.]MCB9049269.1 hypothetical protein [Lewinellaceae bacterium]